MSEERSTVSATLPTEARAKVQEWLTERKDNCLRIAATKSGADKAGWLADAAWFSAALTLLKTAAASPHAAQPAGDSEFICPKCGIRRDAHQCKPSDGGF